MINCQLIVSKIKDKGALDNERYAIGNTESNIRNCSFFVIIIVFVFNYETGEDKGKIRKDEDRIVEYIKEKVELNDNEELRKIEFKKYKKNHSTGTWKFYVTLNDKVDMTITLWGTGGMIYIGSFREKL